MLRTLRIRDLVIIDELTLEFVDGLNLLTGETGAGKSILVDALGLIAGQRADRGLIRSGAAAAVVEALFEVGDAPPVSAWLDDHGLGTLEDGQLVIRRELRAEGAGRTFVNGSPTTQTVLRELSGGLLELHGQHEQQGLLRPERHGELLDAFGRLGPRVAEVGEAWSRWHTAAARREQLLAQADAREERVALLRETVREIDALAPEPGEQAELERERNLLRNAERVAALLERIVAATCEGEPTAGSLAAAAARDAAELAALDPGLNEAAERLRSAALELDDVGASFRDYREHNAFEPGRLDEVESRRAALERLCLRHRTDEAGLLELRVGAAEEAASLDAFEGSLAAIDAELAAAAGAYAERAVRLGRSRRRAARELTRAVSAELGTLALGQARFEVELVPARGPLVDPGDGRAVAFTARGAERPALRLAANPGEPPGPLAAVASGGELSRLTLALHVVADREGGEAAVVFDEVDAGVGGAVADAVGSRLAALARSRQVLCVTHLPQVAAYADRHFRVTKSVVDGRTLAAAETLESGARIDELARMLGGRRTTATSRRHAAELVAAADRVAREESA